MQKTLTLMNAIGQRDQRHQWVTGMAICVRSWRRTAVPIVHFKHNRVRASREEIARSLEGNWREELLFVLEQSLELDDLYVRKIAVCDQRIERHLKTMISKHEPGQQSDPAMPPSPKHEPRFNLKDHLCRIAGVDLTKVAALEVQTDERSFPVGVDRPLEHRKTVYLWLRPVGQPDQWRQGAETWNPPRLSALCRPCPYRMDSPQAKLPEPNFRDCGPNSVPPKRSQRWRTKLARLIYRMMKFGTATLKGNGSLRISIPATADEMAHQTGRFTEY
jgi:hypothetical protein